MPSRIPSRDTEKTKAELLREIQRLRRSLEAAKDGKTPAASAGPPDTLKTISVPEPFTAIFLNAQRYVYRYFATKIEDPEHSTISISGERYILVRAASMSVEFFELVRSLYQDKGEEEARRMPSGRRTQRLSTPGSA